MIRNIFAAFLLVFLSAFTAVGDTSDLPLPVETDAAKLACSTLIYAAAIENEAKLVLEGESLARFVNAYFGEHGLLTIRAVHFATAIVGAQNGGFAQEALLRGADNSANEITNVIIEVFDPEGIRPTRGNTENNWGWVVSREREADLDRLYGGEPPKMRIDANRLRMYLKARTVTYPLDKQAIEEGEKLSALLRNHDDFRRGFEKLIATVLPILAHNPIAIAKGESDPTLLVHSGRLTLGRPEQALMVTTPPAYFTPGSAMTWAIMGAVLLVPANYLGLPTPIAFLCEVAALVWGGYYPNAAYIRQLSSNKQVEVQSEVDGLDILKLLQTIWVPSSLVPTRLAGPGKPLAIGELPPPSNAALTLAQPFVPDTGLVAVNINLKTLQASPLEGMIATTKATLKTSEALSSAYHRLTTVRTQIRERLYEGGAQMAELNLKALVKRLDGREIDRPKRSEVQQLLLLIREEVDAEVHIMDEHISGAQKGLEKIFNLSRESNRNLEEALRVLYPLQPSFQQQMTEFLSMVKNVENARELLPSIIDNTEKAIRSLQKSGEMVAERRKLLDELQHALSGGSESERSLTQAQIDAIRALSAVFEKPKVD